MSYGKAVFLLLATLTLSVGGRQNRMKTGDKVLIKHAMRALEGVDYVQKIYGGSKSEKGGHVDFKFSFKKQNGDLCNASIALKPDRRPDNTSYMRPTRYAFECFVTADTNFPLPVPEAIKSAARGFPVPNLSADGRRHHSIAMNNFGELDNLGPLPYRYPRYPAPYDRVNGYPQRPPWSQRVPFPTPVRGGVDGYLVYQPPPAYLPVNRPKFDGFYPEFQDRYDESLNFEPIQPYRPPMERFRNSPNSMIVSALPMELPTIDSLIPSDDKNPGGPLQLPEWSGGIKRPKGIDPLFALPQHIQA